jgi:putative methionine-R-sulfoxide reductase with GAF domain
MSCSIYRLAPKSRTASLRDGSDAARPLTLCGRTKAETYAAISAALDKFLTKYPVDLAGRMATLNSFLYANFPRMNFVGFYTVKTPGAELQIGPYQGEVLACGTIAFGKGVCGTVAASGTTAVIPDVRAVENYIACAYPLLTHPHPVTHAAAARRARLTFIIPPTQATRRRCRKSWCRCLAARTTTSRPRAPMHPKN